MMCHVYNVTNVCGCRVDVYDMTIMYDVVCDVMFMRLICGDVGWMLSRWTDYDICNYSYKMDI